MHIIALLDHHSIVAFSGGPSVQSLQAPKFLKNDVTTRAWNTFFFKHSKSNTYLTLGKITIIVYSITGNCKLKKSTVHCGTLQSWMAAKSFSHRMPGSFSALNRPWQVMSQGHAVEEWCCEPLWVKKDQTSCIYQTRQILTCMWSHSTISFGWLDFLQTVRRNGALEKSMSCIYNSRTPYCSTIKQVIAQHAELAHKI